MKNLFILHTKNGSQVKTPEKKCMIRVNRVCIEELF